MATSNRIVIVGAGPTGLSAAILLRQRGHDPVVLDRRPSLKGYPAAHVANTRTMEIMAEMGVGERIWAEGDTTALSSRVVWVESMAGREYGVLPIQGAAQDTRAPLSRFRSVNIAQTHMEQILHDRLIELGGSVRFGHRVTDVRNTATGAEVTVETDGATQVLDCDWLLGCDGAGSTVRRSVGIEMEGPPSIARFMTIYFHADFDHLRKGRRALLYWIGGPEVRGVFISFDEIGRSWAMLVPIGDAKVEEFTDEDATAIINKAIGTFDVQVDLDAVSSWNMSAQVANRYREGHVLLAGDACHRFPPTGGLGMNTGVQDAHNLVWKLDAVMSGRAAPALLDSYQQERRPIAQRNTDQSVRNLMKMAAIDEALGVPTLAPIAPDAGKGPIRIHDGATLGIDGDSAAATVRRAAVQAAVDDQAEHFAQGAGIDLGFAYAEGVVVADGSAPPSSATTEYRPDAHPGARLPFSSPDGSFAASTLGHVAPDAITLFAQGDQWQGVAEAAAGAGFAVVLRRLGAEGVDFGPHAAELLGIGPNGAVAVRPDGHVLWRDAEGRAPRTLADAVRLCTGTA
ncbi:FAD-dependent monooxygenase [Paracoccus alkenifer]|uniref:2-polyprenyl-6-methoxyphenol hydroxylase n=1 Tax=Paracoccus alkenifer TaxID=65735 RepID=A0A1H6MQT0_9RHOB|nr:FAD-dependent monooxygenase [Paracoccus alkenifer]SEI00290.1 2-polyprenyl-6-methoxyphenol hydroxylase [Paracoccus alkenifer]